MEEFIKKDIENIDRIFNSIRDTGLNSYSLNKAKELQEELVAKYKSEIDHIDKEFDYGYVDFYNEDNDIPPDYVSNLKKVKVKLEMFIVKMKEVDKKPMKYNTHSMPPVSIVNNNNSNSNSDNNSSNNNNLSNNNSNRFDIKPLLFEEAKKAINDDVSLSDAELEDIINKINELEELHNSDESPRGKWSKSKEVMTWVMTKGPKIATTVLPLITEIIKFNNK